MKDYIGIDLGTTNSIVSYINDLGKYESIKIGRSNIVPSAIFFDSKDKYYFGEDALKRMINNPNCGIRLFKRMLKAPKDSRKIFYKNVGESVQVLNEGEKYLIDTNVFIKYPRVLDRLKKNEKAILSYTVIDELKFRSKDLNTKYQAEDAIENILKYQQKGDERIEFVQCNLDIIPEGLFKNPRTDNDLNDNKILSIGIIKKNQGEKVILVTEDKELRIKAQSCEVENMIVDDFMVNHKMIDDNKEYIEITGKTASAIFLQYLREEASKKLKTDIKKAVITVPANFNQIEVESTKNAGYDAGFEEIRILKEPIAAAMVYGLDSEFDKTILVYDFGGGTFDISIIKVGQDGSMEVISTGGDSKLGGEDITNQIVEYIYEKLEDDYDLSMFSIEESNLDKDQYIYNEQKILERAEQLKIALSEFEEQSISLINIYISKDEQSTISYNFTRSEIENQVLKGINGRVIQILRNSIENSKLKVDDIDVVALAGGTSLIPLFQEGVNMALGKQAKINNGLDKIVSHGAAIMADSIWGEKGLYDKLLLDKTVHDFGVKLHDFTFDKLISYGETLPATAKKKYRPVDKNQKSISIEAYTRNQMSKSIKTFEENNGIEFLDKITITGLPNNIDSRELVIEIEFNIDKEYTLNLDTKLFNKNGELLQCETLRTTRASKLDDDNNNNDYN
ncbi:Hsp70 family protein [Intestinibacter bartlettii]|uniref:Hsp70 family protein n=1 Tax=Intestinibacter bartlettii TaxID=261299 RepID=UPI0022E2EAB8|nr:Hsp70 family protein [Intestinibacter bartlettii]